MRRALYGEGKAYAEGRTRVLEGYGLRVLRFTNTEVLKDFEAACEVIGSVQPGIPPDPP